MRNGSYFLYDDERVGNLKRCISLSFHVLKGRYFGDQETLWGFYWERRSRPPDLIPGLRLWVRMSWFITSAHYCYSADTDRRCSVAESFLDPHPQTYFSLFCDALIGASAFFLALFRHGEFLGIRVWSLNYCEFWISNFWIWIWTRWPFSMNVINLLQCTNVRRFPCVFCVRFIVFE